MKTKRGIKNKAIIFILCLIAVYIFAIAGSILTSQETNSSWYKDNKPTITPPNYVFPIVWNILFVLIAISLFLAWTKAKNNKEKRKVDILFAINLFLNFIWSLLFFTLKNPLLAFIELIVLWISILVMIIMLWKISKTASYLLMPYLIWVSLAAILNFLFI
jgi:tryptophan-rich sensory protein